ncbi:uncharacterized protein BDV14DRAFT_206218 [Aspergillus stella-maris]|uniref:uncharacterized protein n=1 Tax=Aspergillus stella-maris TaxID=1810926 RepID=UPI003CCCD5AD
MASFEKKVLREGAGLTPTFGDKVKCKFWDLTAAGEPIPMYQTEFEFSSAGHAYSVLFEVIGIKHGLSKKTIGILKCGFELFIPSLRSMKKNEWAEYLSEDTKGAERTSCDFSLSVELMEVVPRPEIFAPLFTDWQHCPEDSADGAAPVHCDFKPF